MVCVEWGRQGCACEGGGVSERADHNTVKNGSSVTGSANVYVPMATSVHDIHPQWLQALP